MQQMYAGRTDRLRVDPLQVQHTGPFQRSRHDDRPRPGPAVLDLQRERPPVRQAHRIASLRPGLPDRTRHGAQQHQLVPRRPRDHLRVRPDRLRYRSRGTRRGQRHGPERPRETGQRGGQQRSAAPVHSHERLLLGQRGERRVDALLQRVGRRQVGREVPAVDHAGRQHRRVLPRAVHEDRRPRLARQEPLVTHRVDQRPVLRAPQVRLGQPGRVQDPAYALHVHRLARVRRARQREQVRRQREPQRHHRDGLERLVRRPRQHRRGHVPDRPLDRPVRRERDHGPVVAPLDEPRPHDFRHHLRKSHAHDARPRPDDRWNPE